MERKESAKNSVSLCTVKTATTTKYPRRYPKTIPEGSAEKMCDFSEYHGIRNSMTILQIVNLRKKTPLEA